MLRQRLKDAHIIMYKNTSKREFLSSCSNTYVYLYLVSQLIRWTVVLARDKMYLIEKNDAKCVYCTDIVLPNIYIYYKRMFGLALRGCMRGEKYHTLNIYI